MSCSIGTLTISIWWLMMLLIFGISSQDLMLHSHPHESKQHVACPACLDSRLTQHYQAKSCTPVIYGQCSCPSRYKCPSVPFERQHETRGVLMMTRLSQHSSFRGRSLDQDDEIGSCFYNGTRYELGEVVPTEDVCRICVCGYLPDGSLGVDCETRIECPTTRSTSLGSALLFNTYNHRLTRNLAQLPFKLHCYDFYEHDKCCPRQECMPVHARTGRTLRPRKSCLYAGRQYQLGERIDLFAVHYESENDSEEMATNGINQADDATLKKPRWQLPVSFSEQAPCLTCLCTEVWNNSLLENPTMSEDGMQALLANTKSCRKKNCQLDLDPRFRAGCIPVYHENKCCPVDYICPRTRSMSLRIRGLDAGSKLCQFEGRKYPVGARLYQTQHAAAPCVDCECRVPPDFTCLQRKHCLAPPTIPDNN